MAWQKGESGNPGGRPKGTTLTSVLKATLANPGAEIGYQSIVNSLIKGASEGEPGCRAALMKMLWDRHDGPVPKELRVEAQAIIKRVIGIPALEVEGELRATGLPEAVQETLSTEEDSEGA